MSLLPIVHGGVSVAGFTEATGGDSIITDGSFKAHIFNSSGTLEITKLGADAVVEYLVVAGGASGGGFYYGGGGGAGGYRTATNFAVAKQSYSVTVGAGGAATSSVGTTYDQGNDGSDSIFSTITSDGGGGGGTEGSPAPPDGRQNGRDGGSGGGSSGFMRDYSTAGPFVAGQATAGQGNNGGISETNNGDVPGGGGAGAVGQNGTSSDNAGDGGVGLSSSITGSAVFRAGGGGGGSAGSGSGGNGGGGAGGISSNATAGTVNTGGGGGGGGNPGSQGGAGGSGVVIIRYQFQAA
jgi:hypothetical protein